MVKPELENRPIRPAYVAALEETLLALSCPGTWLDSETRIAVAEVARNALIDEPPLAPWEEPSRTGGKLDALTQLSVPTVAVDAAYRIARHPSTLTKGWYAQITSREANFSDAHYVELVTIVARVAAADRFCRAAGLSLFPFPKPREGAPSGQRPACAKLDRHWVPTIHPKDAADEFAWLYPGKGAPNVLRALTLVPDAYAELRRFQSAGYVASEFVLDVSKNEDRPLTRAQIELIAASTSAHNECFY